MGGERVRRADGGAHPSARLAKLDRSSPADSLCDPTDQCRKYSRKNSVRPARRGGAHPLAGLARARLSHAGAGGRSSRSYFLPVTYLTSYQSYRRNSRTWERGGGVRTVRTLLRRGCAAVRIRCDRPKEGVRTPSQGSHARASRTPAIIPILLLTCYLSYFLLLTNPIGVTNSRTWGRGAGGCARCERS